MSIVVGADCFVLNARCVAGVAAPRVVMQAWSPAVASSSDRSRLHTQQPREVAMAGRSRTPTGERRAAVPLQRHELASMPITFRSGSGDQPLKRVLCYGDSLTAGFCSNGSLFEPYGRAMAESLGEAGVSTEVFVCGLSGGFASEFVAKKNGSLTDVVGGQGKGLARILSEDGPFDLVIIMAGTNDLGRNDAPHEILRSVKQLHKECHQRNIPTVAVAPPPAPVRTPMQEAIRVQLATLISQWAASETEGHVVYQDPAAFVPATPNFGWIWEADRLHFTPAGSRSLGDKMAKLVLANELLPGVEHAAVDSKRSPRRSTSSVEAVHELQSSQAALANPTALLAAVQPLALNARRVMPVMRCGPVLSPGFCNQPQMRLVRVM
eukprot:TRINITY_DN4489_c0_g3_i1.p2 TRINITY_DN4489_c0_g3~~TRINITY_DN4489_c0_g3_i1.p2  ORF type:complete len:380 (+),score=62.92 TRINITY_DN4489_c0_g3_i1:98-1237(+)